MAVVGTEQWSRESEIQREILPDGTLHNKIVMTRRRSDTVEKVAESVETLETFERPPHLDQDMEEIEEIMPDGTKVVRQVAMNRVVHSIKTRHESFDEASGRVVEDYEVEEVVPNTTTAFEAGQDSDYEDEVQEKKLQKLSVDEDTEEIEEVLADGTKVTRKVVLSRVVHTTTGHKDAVDPREGHVHEEYPCDEVVPGTASAVIAGQDSD